MFYQYQIFFHYSGTQSEQDPLQLTWQRGLKQLGLFFFRQRNFQPVRMKEVPFNINGRFLFPVYLIPRNGTLQKSTMQPDLVSPPGKRMELQQGMAFKF